MTISEILARQERVQAEHVGNQRGTRSPSVRFDALFGQAKAGKSTGRIASKPLHTVRKGENLSVICRDRLERQGMKASPLAVHKAVNAVARANGISNPDLIFPGQQIDLSAISQQSVSRPSSSLDSLSRSKGGPVLPPERSVEPRPVDFSARQAPRSPAEATARLEQVVATTSEVAHEANHSRKPWEDILGGRGVLTSPYGTRKDPFTGTQGVHNGIDIAAPKGAEIRAFKEGVVRFAGWRGGYGNLVIIRHDDGLETRYAHASETLVREGQQVGKGTPIASVGSSGRSTGDHLHFEVRQDGKTINPIPFLKQQRLQIAEVL